MKLLIAMIALGCVAQARSRLPGTDDLRGFARASGTYTRSLATDDADGNDDLCSDVVKVEVKVLPLQKRVLVVATSVTYNERSDTTKATLSREAITVGMKSAKTFPDDQGHTQISEINLLAGNAISNFSHIDFGTPGQWQRNEDKLAIVAPGKIHYAKCAFRRI